jgi:hypothetical protein
MVAVPRKAGVRWAMKTRYERTEGEMERKQFSSAKGKKIFD